MDIILIKNFFVSTFNLILYQPLFNALVLIYKYLPGHDFGIAVIVLTILIRIILYPLGMQAIKSQKNLQELQPKLKEIQEKYKNDKEKQARATMELYKKEKINPLSGCLPFLIQIPIMIALYQVFWRGLQEDSAKHLYSFIANPGQINHSFLGIINLGQPSIGLAFLAGISQFFQVRMIPSQPKIAGKEKNKAPDFAGAFQKQTTYILPIFTFFILWKLPSALALYWLVTTVFAIFQQYLIFKPHKTSFSKGQGN